MLRICFSQIFFFRTSSIWQPLFLSSRRFSIWALRRQDCSPRYFLVFTLALSAYCRNCMMLLQSWTILSLMGLVILFSFIYFTRSFCSGSIHRLFVWWTNEESLKRISSISPAEVTSWLSMLAICFAFPILIHTVSWFTSLSQFWHFHSDSGLRLSLGKTIPGHISEQLSAEPIVPAFPIHKEHLKCTFDQSIIRTRTPLFWYLHQKFQVSNNCFLLTSKWSLELT